MNATERTVMLRMLAQVKARGTHAGHLAQQVQQEHRGVCRHDRCSQLCVEWRQVVEDAETALHHTLIHPRRTVG